MESFGPNGSQCSPCRSDSGPPLAPLLQLLPCGLGRPFVAPRPEDRRTVPIPIPGLPGKSDADIMGDVPIPHVSQGAAALPAMLLVDETALLSESAHHLSALKEFFPGAAPPFGPILPPVSLHDDPVSFTYLLFFRSRQASISLRMESISSTISSAESGCT